jgi:hypothetical protein
VNRIAGQQRETAKGNLQHGEPSGILSLQAEKDVN